MIFKTKRINKIISLCLCVVLTVSLTAVMSVNAVTYPCFGTVVGLVNGSALNVRKDAGTSYDSIAKIYNGDSVKVTASKKDSAGTVWYKICYDLSDLSKVGYSSSQYIEIKEETVTSDKDFEKYLTAQGFPESYKEQLRYLHSKYPKWVFKADKINLNWKDVLKNECVNGRSLVSGSAKNSWKSMYNGAYDWSKSQYVTYDSGGWVNALDRVVEHYLDPRNFLNATSIFQFTTHKYDSSQTVANVKKMVSGTFLDAKYPNPKNATKTYDTYSDVLVYAGKQSGVSPYVLASMILTEQGSNGTGGSISGKVKGYEGYYNYFNIGAYRTSTFSSAVERGLWWAKGAGNGATSYKRPWNTRSRSIVGGALWYSDNYVADGQDTLYYKKFNVVNKSSGLYSHQYMTNIQGADTEATFLSRAYKNILNSAITFNIPVFNNMPDKPYALPTSTGANNFFLKSLKVDGYTISPTFDKYTYSYSLFVKNNVSKVKISAAGIQAKTTVSGTGEKTLKEGTNTFSIKAKAESGYTKTYTLKIVREEGKSPTVTSAVYNIGKYITGVKPKTGLSKFLGGLTVKNGTVSVTDSSGSEKAKGNIATGDDILLKNGNTTVSKYGVVIKGDINGDSDISIIDLAKVQKHILAVSEIKGIYLQSADTNGDGNINIIDLAKIQKHILGIAEIKQ